MRLARHLYRKNSIINNHSWSSAPGVHTPGGWTLQNMKIVEGNLDDPTKYWCVISVNAGTANLYKTWEIDKVGYIMIGRKMDDDSTMKVLINGAVVHEISGPNAWEFTPPLKLLPGTYEIRVRFEGVTADGKASVAAIRMWDTVEVPVMFKESTPFIQEAPTKEHGIIRSFANFGRSAKGFASSKFKLVFTSDTDYLEFVANINEVFILQDEFGLWYRGILEASSPESIAQDFIYVDCTFKSPYMAGIGW